MRTLDVKWVSYIYPIVTRVKRDFLFLLLLRSQVISHNSIVK